ncbi:MAG: P-type DNA transfer ATPase VirB11 [Sphingomonas sp.]|nr:P-type DNA transfer ATPase VirB11 [Sphingomonas sp.]
MSRPANDARDAEPVLRYLEVYLAPLAPILRREEVTDIFINRPGEVWAESLDGHIERIAAPELTHAVLDRLARQIANLSHQGINREHPLLSATLPDGARVQVVIPPATRGEIAIAIRKHVVADLTLDDYARSGAMQYASVGRTLEAKRADDRVVADANVLTLLRSAVRERRNILVSGGTSTGKTTFLNALIKEIPEHERLIFIEDTPELRYRHANAVGLVAVKGALGEARVTAEDLLQAALRMRPDRIIVGEIRGSEAYAFLRAVNTGHPGSLTTIHADSPQGAIEQLALIILQSGVQLRREDVVSYAENVVDVFIQLKRGHQGRYISELRLMR